MKKLKIWSIVMLAVMTLPMMVACGGDDNDEGNKLPLTVENLSGTWELEIKNKLQSVYVFRENGSGEYINIASLNVDGRLCYTFNYNIENGKIKINKLKDFANNTLNTVIILDAELFDNNTLRIKGEYVNSIYVRDNNPTFK